MDLGNAAFGGEPTEEELLQRQLFAMSKNHLPAPPENQQELLKSLWPNFEPDKIPRFFELLRKRTVRYVGKTPSKPPKSVQPTKISLELEPDQEKAFKVSTGAAHRPSGNVEEQRTIPILKPQTEKEREEDDIDEESDYENDPVGGVSWQDFQIVCEDWDIPSAPASPASAVSTPPTPTDDLFGPEEIDQPPSKVCWNRETVVILSNLQCSAAKLTPPVPMYSTHLAFLCPFCKTMSVRHRRQLEQLLSTSMTLIYWSNVFSRLQMLLKRQLG